MPSIGTCFIFYTQMRVQKKTKLLPIKLKTVYTTVQWRHKSKISEKLGQCGRQNMRHWDWILCHAVKAFSSLCVRSPWVIICRPWLPKAKSSFTILAKAFKTIASREQLVLHIQSPENKNLALWIAGKCVNTVHTMYLTPVFACVNK